MDGRWFIGYDGEAKLQRQKEVLSYSKGFEELLKLLEGLEKGSERDYGPGWAEKQIAVNEYNQALKDLTALIKHVKN